MIGPGEYRYYRQFLSHLTHASRAEIDGWFWDDILDEVVTALRLREDLEG